MTRQPDASASTDDLRRRLLALLADDELDAALQAGLMDFAAGDAAADAPIRAAQEQLRNAWAARQRHRARAERLARQAAERDARRARGTAPAADAETTPATPAAATAAIQATGTPALPPAAAAALARARARAAGRDC